MVCVVFSEANFFWAPFAFGVLPDRADDFFARAGAFLAAGFRTELAAFVAGLDDLACAFVALGREEAFALAGVFELFFFGELAIFFGNALG